jgi:hypothetical protein
MEREVGNSWWGVARSVKGRVGSPLALWALSRSRCSLKVHVQELVALALPQSCSYPRKGAWKILVPRRTDGPTPPNQRLLHLRTGRCTPDHRYTTNNLISYSVGAVLPVLLTSSCPAIYGTPSPRSYVARVCGQRIQQRPYILTGTVSLSLIPRDLAEHARKLPRCVFS